MQSSFHFLWHDALGYFCAGRWSLHEKQLFSYS